ncbi:hypothetical protein EVAR_39141_1 [Eumeta japonica]|uniref:Uncharacterized protein n=1 Tax=Eumeta variegata TaxID=151549 RepID=A0A4C1X9Z9_EUMVA|nr:hypothetical protein EVAR_39141_1 [Eumeta japonica]
MSRMSPFGCRRNTKSDGRKEHTVIMRLSEPRSPCGRRLARVNIFVIISLSPRKLFRDDFGITGLVIGVEGVARKKSAPPPTVGRGV